MRLTTALKRATGFAAYAALALAAAACDDPESTVGSQGTTGESSPTSADSDGNTNPTAATDWMNGSGSTGDATAGMSTTEGTSTDATESTDTMADGASTGTPTTLNCADHCNSFNAACPARKTYESPLDCQAHCAQWPVGEAEDVGGDTLGCRSYHLGLAADDPGTHCPHAEPSGGGVCSAGDAPDCVSYCDVYFVSCADDNNEYVDRADCIAQCRPWYQGDVDDTTRHTIGCRTYHAGGPARDDPAVHCPHAGPSGAGVCVFE